VQVYYVNFICGDEVILRVYVDWDGDIIVVCDVFYDVLGCVISIVLMFVLYDFVVDCFVVEVECIFEVMRSMLISCGSDLGDEDVFGDGVAFGGVLKYFVCVKCALFGWMVL